MAKGNQETTVSNQEALPKGTVVSSSGYFGFLKYLIDQPSYVLEMRIGYQPGALTAGWQLLVPGFPIDASNIDLRGSSRWSDGVLAIQDGKPTLISERIAARSDIDLARRKVAAFFNRGGGNRPAKVRPINETFEYPNSPSGIPQFKTLKPIEWVVLLTVPGGGVLRESEVAASGHHA